MDRAADDALATIRTALSSYGIPTARLKPLEGGTLNSVFRVETFDRVLVLKEYAPNVLKWLDLRQVCEAQQVAHAHGLPVPPLVQTVDGHPFASIGNHVFTLAEFIQGKTYGVDAMPEVAARSAGVMLAKLQDALAELPSGPAPEVWTRERVSDYLEGLLLFADARRHRDPVDERASVLIRQKLSLLRSLEKIPTYEPGWTHGDYHWRNLLFDEEGEVAGIIDFDTVAYYSPARDVMRCISLSFPSLGPAAFAFFEGYARVKGITADKAREHVEFYRYISTYRVWPAAARYLEPETYDTRWDDLIQPIPDWDWARLSDRFAAIAAFAGGAEESAL